MLGVYQMEHMSISLKSFSLAALTRIMNCSVEEVTILLAGVRSEFKNPKNRLMTIFHFVYGKKPVS